MPTTEVKQLSDRLPTSFIGKLADWIAANNTLTVFTWFGTALTFTWLVVFARSGGCKHLRQDDALCTLPQRLPGKLF